MVILSIDQIVIRHNSSIKNYKGARGNVQAEIS